MFKTTKDYLILFIVLIIGISIFLNLGFIVCSGIIVLIIAFYSKKIFKKVKTYFKK